MTDDTSDRKVAALRTNYPKSYADDLGIDVGDNTPAFLYQWLLASLLFSAPIGAGQAVQAAGALFHEGWMTPEKMRATGWDERVRVLNRNGYARYDESTAGYIGDCTDLLVEEYGGDLRNLRDAAGRDPDAERDRVTGFKGIGNVGADIFFRHVQAAWDELYPFADSKSLEIASNSGLATDAHELAELAGSRENLPRLLDALIKADLQGQLERIVAAA